MSFSLRCRPIVQSIMLNIEDNETGQVFIFKVDIIQENSNQFTAELYERIYYRLSPCFDIPEPDWESHEELWVLASAQLREDTTSTTPEACLQKVLVSLNHAFGFQAA